LQQTLYKKHILLIFLYVYIIAATLAFVLALIIRNYTSGTLIIITLLITLYLIWNLKKNLSVNVNTISLIWLWTLSIYIFIHIPLNGFSIEISYALFIPLIASMLLNRISLIVNGVLFIFILSLILLYGYIVYPQYMLYDNPVFITSFIMLVIFTFVFATIYHIYIEHAYTIIAQDNEEKEILLQEIHHRVKNNLNMMSSILGLQSKSDNSEIIALVQSNRQRLDSIAMVHEILYDSKNFTHIDFKSYVEKLAHHLIYVCAKEPVEIDIKSTNMILSLDTMASLGLIMQELLTNSLKYAVVDGGKIHICLEQETNKNYILRYHDSGQTLKVDNIKQTLGIRLIELKTKQLGGTMLLNTTNGYDYTIKFHDGKT